MKADKSDRPARHDSNHGRSAERLRTERDLLDLLLELARLLDRYPDLSEAAAAFMDLLISRTALRAGWVAFLDNADGWLEVAVSRQADTMPVGTKIRLGDGVAGRVFENATSLINTDAALSDQSRRSAGGGSRLYAPLLHQGAVVGLLSAALLPGSAAGSSSGATAAESAGLALLERAAGLLADSYALRLRLGQQSRSAVPGAREDSGAADHQVRPVEAIGRSPFGNMIGTSTAMQEVFQLIGRVAPTEATVLILGESGTGKELCAADLHQGSRRCNGPLVKVNCAALPESIIESELFGHERGSFTGAVSQRKGRFEQADGGTIFLDEIGELSPAVQVKLLRVLQEREIERVGGSSRIPVDVRVIAATNRRLEDELAAGRFREDLYYRLNVFPLRMPPLRQRTSDILLLADWFVEKYATRNHKAVLRISSPAIDLLASYHWPGNVRELENSIERAVILSTDKVIHSWHLPPSLQSAASTHTEPSSTLAAALARLEKELIVEALKLQHGNMAAAARRLGITERQMGLRVRHYGLDWRQYRPNL